MVQLHRTLYISVDKPPLRQYSESAFEILCILCYGKDKDHNTYTLIIFLIGKKWALSKNLMDLSIWSNTCNSRESYLK